MKKETVSQLPRDHPRTITITTAQDGAQAHTAELLALKKMQEGSS